jgi:hypothetical protein
MIPKPIGIKNFNSADQYTLIDISPRYYDFTLLSRLGSVASFGAAIVKFADLQKSLVEY